MARTRKPQSPVGVGRVASTTTNSQQTVYRFGNGHSNPSCPAPTSSVTTASPLHVRINGTSTYHVTLDMDELKEKIEQYDTLDLSNVAVTLNTVEGPVTVTGDLNVENGTFTASAGSIDALTSVQLISETATIASISAESVTTDTATVNNNLTVNGTSELKQTNITTANIDTAVVGIGNVTSLSATNATIRENLTVQGNSTVNGLTKANGGAEVHNGLTVTGATTLENTTVNGTSTLVGDVTTNSNVSVGQNLTVQGNETVTGTETVNGATLLNGTLNVAGNTTFASNVSMAKDLTVSGNETVSGNQTVAGNTITNGTATFNNKIIAEDEIEAKDNVNVSRNLTVDGVTTLKGATEVKSTLDVDGATRLKGNVTASENLTVAEQISSDTIRTNEVVADELRVNKSLYLNENAEAPDFVLQTEKNAPNGIPVLDENGKLPVNQLPDLYTTAIVKMGSGIFNNSDTCIIEDPTITADSYVNISNYTDIIGDVNEIIHPGQITLVSNNIETGSFKYIVVNPLS